MTQEPLHKVCQTTTEALMGLKDGARVMVGGFGLCGNAEALIEEVATLGMKDLTLISNNAGNMGMGLTSWIRARIVRRIICTYVGTNEDVHKAMADGGIEVDVIPQGTFVERIRAAGAGIPAFYTPTGVGTVVADGKEVRTFDGREYVLERALFADFALIRAHESDSFGNLRFRRTARNFAPAMATAAAVTIVEADSVLPLGAIDPDDVHLPGIFVHRIVEVKTHHDPFEYKINRAL